MVTSKSETQKWPEMRWKWLLHQRNQHESYAAEIHGEAMKENYTVCLRHTRNKELPHPLHTRHSEELE